MCGGPRWESRSVREQRCLILRDQDIRVDNRPFAETLKEHVLDFVGLLEIFFADQPLNPNGVFTVNELFPTFS